VKKSSLIILEQLCFGSVQIKNFELHSNELESLVQKIKALKGSNPTREFMSISNTKIYLINLKDKFWNS